MPDQSYAARLRERAETARKAAETPARAGFSHIAIYSDEADAIADALEAGDEAPCTCTPSWTDPDTGEEQERPLKDLCRFHRALAALDRRAGREVADRAGRNATPGA